MKRADELRKILTNTLVSSKRSVTRKWMEQMEIQYNYPQAISFDYLSLRKGLDVANDFELFIITSIIKPDVLSNFFVEKEIKFYSKSKWETPKLDLPLEFPVIPISDRQWIGSISVKTLMNLRDNQMINYNENTQRTMKHQVKGNKDYWQINLNKKSVSEIESLLQKNRFIPNTLTLNIPQESNFYYNEKTGKLVISDIKYFDIIDGYHRFIALSKCYTLDETFDFRMELRLVCFDENIANQFISQEDKRNPIRKADSKFMDQYTIENSVVRRLNESSNLSGMLVKNGGMIDPAIFAQYIRIIFLREKVKESEINVKSIELYKDIKQKINALTDEHTELLSEKWNKQLMLAILISIKKYSDPDKIWTSTKLLKEINEYKNLNMFNPTYRFIDSLLEKI